jgi:8-oxo-dGTP pyrophosphatase MutT (NUDIX family)
MRLSAAREVQEELGITPPLGRLLAVDWAPSEGEGDKVLYIFDGGELTPEDRASISLQPDELKDFAFAAPQEASERTIPRLARRAESSWGAERPIVSSYEQQIS